MIQQFVGDGALVGGELAQQVLDGGQGLVASLNEANKKLQDAANSLGVAVMIKGHSTGGLVDGIGTGTSDSLM